MTKAYQLAILGGGCSGLSLASALIKHRYTKSIVIIEPRQHYYNDRSWGIWATRDHSLKHLITKRWQKWRLSSGNESIIQSGESLSYQLIPALCFYQAKIAEVKNANNIDLLTGVSASDLRVGSDGVTIKLNQGQLIAKYVIDTRPRAEADNIAMLWQVFCGAEVETSTEAFDDSTAELMGSLKSDTTGLKFIYCLPFSSRRALVQTTRFSLQKYNPSRMNSEFKDDLSVLVQGKVRIAREENGLLPMGQTPLPAPSSDRIIKAGQAAGALRASSGYGFLRIQAWAEATAKSISATDQPLVKPHSSNFENTMDKLFLTAMCCHPHTSSEWFMALAKELTGEEFARFMCGDVPLVLWLKIIKALPKSPFLYALKHTVFKNRKASHITTT